MLLLGQSRSRSGHQARHSRPFIRTVVVKYCLGLDKLLKTLLQLLAAEGAARWLYSHYIDYCVTGLMWDRAMPIFRTKKVFREMVIIKS